MLEYFKDFFLDWKLRIGNGGQVKPHLEQQTAENRTNAFFPNIFVGVVGVEQNHLGGVLDEGLRLGQTDVLAVDARRHGGDDVEAEGSDGVFFVVQTAKSVWKYN